VIIVHIKPSDVDIDPLMLSLCGRTGFTKNIVLVEVSIDGQVLPETIAVRLPSGPIVITHEAGASDHPLWQQAVPIIEQEVKRFLDRGKGGQ
jgi:hypothetical protein